MSAFDDLTDVYELMIDWPKRLARETPFFRRQFNRINAKRVLDAACGTGHHASLFHSWGLDVEAADISPSMLDRARKNASDFPAINFVHRGFDQDVSSSPFDAVICVGNSLALAADLATVHRAVSSMVGALRPGGLLITQVLNVFALPDGPCVWQKNLQVPLHERRTQILKGVHRSGNRGFVELVVADLETPANPLRSESVPFLALEPADLVAPAQKAGAKTIALLGNYDEKPYAREKSPDLILLAEK